MTVQQFLTLVCVYFVVWMSCIIYSQFLLNTETLGDYWRQIQKWWKKF